MLGLQLFPRFEAPLHLLRGFKVQEQSALMERMPTVKYLQHLDSGIPEERVSTCRSGHLVAILREPASKGRA